MENKTINTRLMPKVIGKIELPINVNTKVNLLGCCADCDTPFKDIHNKIKITRTDMDENFKIKSSDVRYVCEFCADELFADDEPKSIFEHRYN